MPDLTAVQWCLAVAAGLLVGFAKTGIAGIGILAIPLMAMAFGAKASVGALLPMLIVGDFVAVGYYRRHAVWPCLIHLLPWVGVGLALGFLALGPLKGPEMQLVLGTLILALVGLQVARKRFGEWAEHRLPHTWWFSATIGVLAGFATMLANAAGPIMVLYFLTRNLPKKEFIGTGAWYYLIVNLIKAPLFCTRGMITADSLLLNAWMAPAILFGAVLGILALPRIPQELFTRAVLVLAFIASAYLAVAAVWALWHRSADGPPPVAAASVSPAILAGSGPAAGYILARPGPLAGRARTWRRDAWGASLVFASTYRDQAAPPGPEAPLWHDGCFE